MKPIVLIGHVSKIKVEGGRYMSPLRTISGQIYGDGEKVTTSDFKGIAIPHNIPESDIGGKQIKITIETMP